jgi:hypothetical protein
MGCAVRVSSWRCVAVRGGGGGVWRCVAVCGGGGMGWLDFLRVRRGMLVGWGAVVAGEVG